MACSLQRMACFLKQRSLSGRNGNNIAQLELFGESAWDFISAIFEAGWDQLYSSDTTSIRDKVKTHLGNLKDQGIKSHDNSTPMEATNRKVPPPIPPRLTRKQMEKSKIHGKTAQSPTYAQAANSSVNILKIKEAFPALPNKKIIEIHNAAFPNPGPKNKKIQSTTKGLSRKQALVPVSTNLANVIMEEANNHVFQINSLLRNIKSTLRAEFICPCPGGISINTNNVPNTSDLTVMEHYLKSIEGAKNDEILAPRLPQSKSYLKITGIPYVQPSGEKLTSEDITNCFKHLELFESISLAAKPRIIKASPKSNMAIIWFDIWDSQSGSKAKLLINHSFNFGRFITTIRATNMNPSILQCHNCWKWGHLTFSYRAHCYHRVLTT